MARKRQDATGDFLRKAFGPKFFPTSSGYKRCVTAGGVDLGRAGYPAKVLEKFRALPEKERAAGAITVGEHGAVDRKVVPAEPPQGGLILSIHGRMLARKGTDGLRRVTADDFPLMADHDENRRARNGYLFEASTDHIWILENEWRAWIPAGDPVVGWSVRVDERIARRIARFHLTPQRVYAEGGEWNAKLVRQAELTLTIVDWGASSIRFRMEGRMAMGSEYEKGKATTPNGPLARGYEPRIAGVLEYDRERQAITRIEAVALGDSWGRVGDANGKSVSIERPGRNPLAFAMELVTNPEPVDCLVPMGRASKLKGFDYFGERRR
ncbi:MAG: hypothetical protein ACKJSK_01420 [Roseibacillus sp.]